MRATVGKFCAKHSLEEIYITKFDQIDSILTSDMSAVLQEWAAGLEIVQVRVTKPKIPSIFTENFMKIEKSRLELELHKHKAEVQIQ